MDFRDQKLELTYPCAWTYTVIGREEDRLREVISELMSGLEHELERSNRSPGGKYVSLRLETTVTSEAHRLAIFAGLSDHEDVRFVL